MNNQERFSLCRDLEQIAFGAKEQSFPFFHPRRFDTYPSSYEQLKHRMREMGFCFEIIAFPKDFEVEVYCEQEATEPSDLRLASFAESESEQLAFCLAAREALREREARNKRGKPTKGDLQPLETALKDALTASDGDRT